MEKEKLFLVVSNDEFELPMCCERSMFFISKFVGISQWSLFNYFKRDSLRVDMNCKFRKVVCKDGSKGKFRIELLGKGCIKEKYIFNNFEDFLDYRSDLVALGEKDNIRCYVEF